MSWVYQKQPESQVPTTEYVQAVWQTYTHFQNLSNSDASLPDPPLVYLASDSASAASEFTELLVANDSLAQKYGNETLKPVVYELRTSTDPELRNLSPAMEYVQAEWNNRTEVDRIRETRGVIVDWALLSGAWTHQPDDVIGNATDMEINLTAAICTLPYVVVLSTPLIF